jgi:putative sterol carrier protein
LHADEAAGVELDIEYHLDEDEIVHIRVDDGALRYDPEPALDPDLVVHASLATLADLGDGSLRAADAIADGRLVLDGPREMVRTYARLFSPNR